MTALDDDIDRLAALPDSVRPQVSALLDHLRELTKRDLSPARTTKLVEESEQAWTAAIERCRADPGQQIASIGRIGGWYSFIGENVRNLRESVGWTQVRLAAAMARLDFKWKRITVAEVERGSRKFTLEELLALGSIFGEPVALLLTVRNQSALVAIPGRLLSPDVLNSMLVGEGNTINPVDVDWAAAREVARIGDGDTDWRAVPERVRRAKAGFG